MGPVVDWKLKVIGVQELSVISTVIAGGNSLPTIVITEKASAMVIEEHGV